MKGKGIGKQIGECVRSEASGGAHAAQICLGHHNPLFNAELKIGLLIGPRPALFVDGAALPVFSNRYFNELAAFEAASDMS